jgi:hypothetical protein
MFTQVLGTMTSLLEQSQSKERPFVLLHSQAIFSVSQQPIQHLTMLQAQSYRQVKTFLREDVILLELLSANLSDVPEDILVISENVKDDSVRERKTVPKTELQ